MKTLYLMRHAEAISGTMGGLDYERYLTHAGCLQTKQQAVQFIKLGLPIPQLIISSSAWRASQTATIFASQLAQNILIESMPDMYNADPKTLLQIVNAIDDKLDCVLLVAHNIGISEFAAALTCENNKLLPTAGIVAAQFMVDNWQAIDFDLGKKLCQIVQKL